MVVGFRPLAANLQDRRRILRCSFEALLAEFQRWRVCGRGPQIVGGARGMRATILEKAVAVRLATAMGHFETKARNRAGRAVVGR